MKNKILICASIVGMLLPMSVSAKELGSATVEFTGCDTVKVGETFKVQMNVKDVYNTYNGIVALGGKLSFDESMVEYISVEQVNAPYGFQYNEKSNMLAGLDYTLDNGIKGNVTIYEFTFKALVSGNTTITLEEAELSDSTAILDSTVIGKTIKVESKEETKKLVKEVKTVEKKEVKKVVDRKQVAITNAQVKLANLFNHIKNILK